MGRRSELAVFDDNFGQDAEDEAHQFLFHVHGQAGVGKTSLVRQFEQTARGHGAPTACVDEGTTGVPEAMAAISAQLERQGHPLKAFDKLLATYRERRHEAESAVQGPQAQHETGPSTGSLAAARAGLAGLGLVPGVGALAGAVDPGQVARGADRLRGLLSARLRSPDDVQLVLSPLDALTPVFVRDLGAVAENVPWLALFFDTYERTGPFLDTWLRDVLVSDRYGPLALNVVVTLAGQTELDRRCWADYLDCVSDIALDPFTATEARQFLAARQITDERVVEEIWRLSGGLPVLVSTLAENRPPGPDAVDDPSDTAVERFLKWESDPVRRQAALAAALPRTLDEDVYRLAVDPDAAGEFGWLRSLPFVAERAGSWQYHQVVRTAMLRLQRRRSPQTWAARHGRLADAAAARCAELAHGRPPQEQWADERWLEHRLQGIYHGLCADARTALPQALTDVLDATEYAAAAVRRIARTLVEAGEDGDVEEAAEWGGRLHAACTDDTADGGAEPEVLTALLARGGEEQARVYRLRGRAHRRRSDWPAALADYDHCLELDPGYAKGHVGRGVTRQRMRDFDGAVRDFTRALELDPGSATALSNRAETYRMMGRHAEAVAEFDRALALDPSLTWAVASRGSCLRRLSRYEEALAGLTRAIERRPAYTWAMAERAEAYRMMGRYQDALEEFDRALAINPDYVWARAHRGVVLRYLGRREEALSELTRISNLRFGAAWLAEQRIELHLLLGRPADALTDIDRELRDAPDAPELLLLRGQVRCASGQLTAALEDLDRAVELGQDSVRCRLLRGRVQLFLGRTEQALADFERATECDRQCAHALALQAGCHRRAGRADDARRALEAALALAPDDPYVGYEAALTGSAERGVAELAGEWDALRSRCARPEAGVPGSAAAFVVSRCALADWSAVDGALRDLLPGAAWEVPAEIQLGVRDLAGCHGADGERLEALGGTLARMMESATIAGPNA